MKAWQQIYRKVVERGESFYSNLDKVEYRQKKVFHNIIKNNVDTFFGQKYRFKYIHNVKDFRENVPLQTYERVSPEIKRICNGEQNVLTSEKVVVIEETGGSTTGPKQIPYTNSSLTSFQSALYPWMYDLLSHRPGIKAGSAYWSISPALTRIRKTSGGIPIGLPSDADYFGNALSNDIINTLAVPPAVAGVVSYQEWQYWTLRFLLAAEDLSFISVWSPTFLLELLNGLREQSPSIVDDIQDGEFRYRIPAGLTDDQLDNLTLTKQRLSEIKRALLDKKINTKILWPKLDTISCWLDAQSSIYRKSLTEYFPDVYLQAKGLLATEGVVSIPDCDTGAGVLTLDSAFYEFIDNQDKIYLAHQLLIGKTYRVLISTYAGLYRYELGDNVTVSGFKASAPLLKFVGRKGVVSDLCGEKLTEDFISQQLQELTGQVILVPDSKQKPGYCLIVEFDSYPDYEAKKLTEIIDQRLRENPQYAYAREIGQLDSIRYLRLPNIWRCYTEYQCQLGRCLGDIKPTVFSHNTDIIEYFTELSTASNRAVI